MGLYYQSVMDKSKLIKVNRLYNKIENLKKEIEHISRFEMEGKIHFIGIVLLMALMVYVTWNDIVRFIVPLFS